MKALIELTFSGYRESVNMSQVKTFIEMDSHEERVYAAVRQTQEREAKQKMREKAKELSKLKRTMQMPKPMGSSLSALSASSNFDKPEPTVGDKALGSAPSQPPTPIVRTKGPSRALKLGSKSGQNSFFAAALEEQLVNELKEEVPEQISNAYEHEDDIKSTN